MEGLYSEKLLVCFGGRLIEENCKYGVVYALKVRKATSLSLKETYLHPTEMMV